MLALLRQPPQWSARPPGGGVGSSAPGGPAGPALSGGPRRAVALAVCPPVGLERRLLASARVSPASGGISFSRGHWAFGSQVNCVFPSSCLVLINGQGFRVSSGGAVPTVLAFPYGAAAESQFLTTAPLCLSIFLVKMCIFLFSKF